MTAGVAITGGAIVAPSGEVVPAASVPAEWRERVGRVERISALALAAGFQAVEQAGIDVGARRDDAGVVLGTAFGCFLTNAEFQRRVAAGGPSAASPRLFAATVSNAAAGELGIALGFAGPGITLSAGGASATAALGHAAALIERGAAQLLLAGGVDAGGPALASFIAAGGLEVGAPLREAAALAVIEPAELALRRGARVRGLLVGHGTGFEPEPNAAGRGLERAIAHALDGIRGDVVAIASAASPAMRALGERAATAVLGRPVRQLAFAGDVGHAMGASGGEALLRVLETEPSRGVVLIVDACASGHTAALAVRVGDGT
jgi:3-oxoacyl-[acyl-carrier-protein] synthase II